VLQGLAAITLLLQTTGKSATNDAVDILANTAQFLKHQIAAWLPDVPTAKNPAKQLALEVAGTSPVIYAGTNMFPAAYKWKINFNENAKNVAWCNEIPEFSHNEFIGWSSHPVEKPYSIIELRSTFEHPRIQKRFEVTERLLSGHRPHPHIVQAQGSSTLDHMLYSTVFGDFVSVYTALLNGLDPSPVDLIETMKRSLDDSHRELN
jgi:glucose/mannose-6-phosphate isomerase